MINEKELQKRAERYAYRNKEALARAGHEQEDLVCNYLETLPLAMKNYDPQKGNLGQFCSGVLANVFKDMTKENKKAEGCQFVGLDDIVTSYEASEESESESADGADRPVRIPNHAFKASLLDRLQAEEVEKMSGMARIDGNCYLEIAEKVFKDDSLAYGIFRYRFFAHHNVKRTELADIFKVSVEKIRWTEKKIASAASKFDLKPLTEDDQKRRFHNCKEKNKGYEYDPSKIVSLTTTYRR